MRRMHAWVGLGGGFAMRITDLGHRSRQSVKRPGIEPGRLPRRVVVIEYLMNEKRVRQNC